MTGDARAELFEAFARHVNPGKVAAFRRYGFDPVMGRREGIRFWDAFDERSWIDCHGNGGVFNLGHRHPRVLEAVTASLAAEDIGNHHLVSPARAELAARLAATTGGRLEGVVFGVGGGEAMDLALKLARAVTGRSGVVSAAGGYHGHTGLAMAAGDPQYRDPFGPNLPGFTQVPFDDPAALERAVGPGTAAVVLEPVPATLGMPIPTPGYLPAVQGVCRAAGALLIVDEVQTGLGRTGRMWAHQHEGLEPDMLVAGKGLSGGVYPISATLMTSSLHRFFEDHPFVHISTFGGAEPGCRAGLAVLDEVETPGFLERVEHLGARFEAGLGGLPFEVRRLGMMMGLRFPFPDGGLMATGMLVARGLFAVWANNDTSVLQFLPPLVCSDDEADEIVGILREVFG